VRQYTRLVVVSLVAGAALAGRIGGAAAQAPVESSVTPVSGAWTPRVIATARPVAEVEQADPAAVPPARAPAPGVAAIARTTGPDQLRLVADPPTVGPAPPQRERATPPGAWLVVEKVGPTVLASGKPLLYDVVVRNLGGGAAEHVRVEEQVSPGAAVAATEPRAEVRGNTLAWDLGSLGAGAEARLHVTLQPGTDGEVNTTATVTCATVSTLQTRIARPGLVLSVIDPPPAQIGQKVTFKFQLANNTGTPLTKLALHIGLASGLRHAAGNQIEATIPALAAGELQTVPLDVVVFKAGRQGLTATLAASGVGQTSAEGAVEVSEAAAAAPVPGPVPATVTRSPEVRPSPPPVVPPAPAAPAPRTTLPPPPPTPQPAPDSPMPPLPAPQSRAVPARATEKPIASAGGPAVTLGLADPEPALEVGGETTYEIHVLNRGAAPTRDVLVQAVVPDEMTLLKADGPAGQAARVQGQQVAFGPLASLDGQDFAVYRVRVKATKPGDGRFTASLQCGTMARPLSQEVSTRVYTDQAGGEPAEK